MCCRVAQVFGPPRAATGTVAQVFRPAYVSGTKVPRYVPRYVSGATATQAPSGIGEDAAAKALLDRVVAAKGGIEKLKAIRTIAADTASTAQTPEGPIEAAVMTRLEYPNRVHVEIRAPQGTQVQVYDGRRAWVRDPMGVHDVEPRMVRELEAGLKRDAVALLVAAEHGDLRVRVLPDVKDPDSGKLSHALELSSSTLDPIVLYVEPESALIVKQTYVAGGPGQPLIEERFGDYRLVDGVQVPFTATVTRGGQKILERRLTDIRFNTPLDPTLFRRPSP